MEVTSFPTYRIDLDFTISPEIAVLRDRIARFVDQDVLPVEADRSAWDPHENIGDEALQTLRQKARQEDYGVCNFPQKQEGWVSLKLEWRFVTKQ